eukprot:556058-Pyramimonas_sp.AAC.1
MSSRSIKSDTAQFKRLTEAPAGPTPLPRRAQYPAHCGALCRSTATPEMFAMYSRLLSDLERAFPCATCEGARTDPLLLFDVYPPAAAECKTSDDAAG